MKQPIPVVDDFQHSHRKYMCETCCCGEVHCQIGAKRVGIFVAILQFFKLILNGLDFVSYFVFVTEVSVTVLLFMGIRQMNPRLTLPYVAFTFLGVLDLRTVSFVALLCCSLGLLINYWFFNIVKRCYTYLLDFEDYRKVHGTVAIDVQGLVQP